MKTKILHANTNKFIWTPKYISYNLLAIEFLAFKSVIHVEQTACSKPH